MIYSFPPLISQKGSWGLGAAILGCGLLAVALKSNQEPGLEERFQKACLLVIVQAFPTQQIFSLFQSLGGEHRQRLVVCQCLCEKLEALYVHARSGLVIRL